MQRNLTQPVEQADMKISRDLVRLTLMGGLLIAGTAVFADGDSDNRTRFSDFTPLPASAGPIPVGGPGEATPLVFGNPDFVQRSIADRFAQLAAGVPNSGNWDMNTVNENGPHKGRYLFTVFETGQSGVQRIDLRTGEAETIWYSPAPGGHIAFDASYWTPWGTYITAEENWTTAAGGATTNRYGRLFEFRNPTTADAITLPLTPSSNDDADFLHRNVIPRVSHEGIQFDEDGNMYFIDELNGGSVYKYTPAASYRRVLSGRADYFDAGQTFVLRVGDGTVANATGGFTWVPITDRNGVGLPGTLTITDPNGVTSLDARNTTDLPDFRGTNYQRPEDLQIQRVHGREYLYMTTTTTNQVYRLDLRRRMITVFADRTTTDLATGAPVGAALGNVDNLAIDHEGNIYIIEDSEGGSENDIWFANDRNRDGDLLDRGEGLARWASNGTQGSELTGLYFDPRNKRRAWVNIQHPDSTNDRTIEITIAGHGDADDDDDRDDDDDDRHKRGRGRDRDDDR
jgi:sugar lactone lactonase YvrE